MRIIAYTYEADYHCIDCTKERFNTDTLDSNYPAQLNDANGVPTNPNRYHGSYGVIQLIDNEGNEIHPLFSTDEWYDINKPSVFADGTCDHDWDWQCVCNDTQYLACGDCHEVIEEYTHTN